jgi:hypothetical protein
VLVVYYREGRVNLIHFVLVQYNSYLTGSSNLVSSCSVIRKVKVSSRMSLLKRTASKDQWKSSTY